MLINQAQRHTAAAMQDHTKDGSKTQPLDLFIFCSSTGCVYVASIQFHFLGVAQI